MSFVWPRERYDALTTEAIVVAIAVTVGAGAAIALPFVTVYGVSNGASASPPDQPREIIAFVEPLRRPRLEPRGAASVRREAKTPATIRVREKGLENDTSSLARDPVGSRGTNSEPTVVASDGTQPAHALGPFGAQAGTTLRPNTITQPKAAPPLPFVAWLPTTQAEIDIAGREQSQRTAQARDEHRPMPIPLGGGVSMPMPFGGAVRSREQRARDSTINADYLLRLARLQERARAKRDSIRGANVLAKGNGAVAPP